jgi:hypothetical protein
MSQHPINLAVRFLLELAALAAYGVLGWHLGPSLLLQVVLALVFVVLAALVWGLPAVAGDRGRSEKGPLMVPGWVRLIVEMGVLVGAVWSFYIVGADMAGFWFAIVAIVQCLTAYDRILWLAGFNSEWSSRPNA